MASEIGVVQKKCRIISTKGNRKLNEDFETNGRTKPATIETPLWPLLISTLSFVFLNSMIQTLAETRRSLASQHRIDKRFGLENTVRIQE